MPIHSLLDAKRKKSPMPSNPSVFLLAPMLVCFVARSSPLAAGIEAPHRVEPLFMPEQEVILKYDGLIKGWQELNHKHNILRNYRAPIAEAAPEVDLETRIATRRKLSRTYANIMHEQLPSDVSEEKTIFNKDGSVDVDPRTRPSEQDEMKKAYASGRAQGSESASPEKNSMLSKDDSDSLDPKARAAMEKKWTEADANTEADELASTVEDTIPDLDEDGFEITYNALRYAELWAKRNRALQWGELYTAFAWTNKASSALDRTFQLQMKHLWEGKLPPNPYKTLQWFQKMHELRKVTSRHQIFIPRSETLQSKLNEIAVNREAIISKLARRNDIGATESDQIASVQHNGNGFTGPVGISSLEELMVDPETYELEQKAQEKLNQGDVIGCLRFLRQRHEKLYPEIDESHVASQEDQVHPERALIDLPEDH